MLIMKFGGTSVGTAERIRTACHLVMDRIARRPLVVLSAHNSPTCRMTDTLIETAHKALKGIVDPERVFALQRGICKDLGLPTSLVDPLLEEYARLLTGIAMIGELSPRTLDLVQSFGERMSCRVFTAVLQKEFKANAEHVTSYDLGLRTDANFGAAAPDPTSYPTIAANVEALRGSIIVTTGFLGKGPDGHITTLGRGGSDYSATIFAAAVGAEEVEIWTDVDGVMTADPKIVPEARIVPELSFCEASELAWFGAKVLHPSTMIPAIEHDIPVRVLNTANPSCPGTVIRRHAAKTEEVAKSIAHRHRTNLVTITTSRMLGASGFMAKVFEIFGKHKIDIQMIATSEISISLTIPKDENLDAAVEDLRKIGDVVVEKDKGLVSIVGENMAGTLGVAKRVTGALADAGVNIRMISQGASELNIALLVNSSQVDTAVRALHAEFFGKTKASSRRRKT